MITSVSCLPVALATEVPFYLRNQNLPMPSPSVAHPTTGYIPGKIPYADWVIKQAANVAEKLAQCYRELALYPSDSQKDKIERSWVMKKIEKKSEYLRFLDGKFKGVTNTTLSEAGYNYENLMSGDPSRNPVDSTTLPVAMAFKTSKHEAAAPIKVQQTKDLPKNDDQEAFNEVKVFSDEAKEENILKVDSAVSPAEQPVVIHPAQKKDDFNADISKLSKLLSDNHDFVCDINEPSKKADENQPESKAVLMSSINAIKEDEENEKSQPKNKNKDPEDLMINEIFSNVGSSSIIDEVPTHLSETKAVENEVKKPNMISLPKKVKITKVESKPLAPEAKKIKVVVAKKEVELKPTKLIVAPVVALKKAEPIMVKEASVSMGETKIDTAAPAAGLVVKDASVSSELKSQDLKGELVVKDSSVSSATTESKAEFVVKEAAVTSIPSESKKELPFDDIFGSEPVIIPEVPAAPAPADTDSSKLATPVITKVEVKPTPTKIVELQAPQDVLPMPIPESKATASKTEIVDTVPMTAPLPSIDAPAKEKSPEQKDEAALQSQRIEAERKEFDDVIDLKKSQTESDKMRSDIFKSIPVQTKKEEVREEVKPQPVLEEKREVSPAPIIEAHPSGVILEEGEIQEANGPSY